MKATLFSDIVILCKSVSDTVLIMKQGLATKHMSEMACRMMLQAPLFHFSLCNRIVS